MSFPREARLNRDRTIGLELELRIPRLGIGGNYIGQRHLARLLTEQGLGAVATDSKEPVPLGCDLAIVYDSSIGCKSVYRGVPFFQLEVKTRKLFGLGDFQCVVPNMLRFCKYMQAQVPPASCGMHLHLDFPEVKGDVRHARSLWALVKRFEPVLYGLVPRCRRTNGYAEPLPFLGNTLKRCRQHGDLEDALKSIERYHGLNLTPLTEQQPHVEIRYNAATFNVDHVRRWVMLWLQLLEHAVTTRCKHFPDQVENTRHGLTRLLTCSGLLVNKRIYSGVAPELRATGRWAVQRWKQLNEKRGKGRTW